LVGSPWTRWWCSESRRSGQPWERRPPGLALHINYHRVAKQQMLNIHKENSSNTKIRTGDCLIYYIEHNIWSYHYYSRFSTFAMSNISVRSKFTILKHKLSYLHLYIEPTIFGHNWY